MASTQQEGTGPAAIERAEQLLERAGVQIGRLIGLTGLRVQRMAQAVREKAEQGGEPAPQHGNGARAQEHEAGQLATERAEVMVDQFGQQLSHWTQGKGFQARKVMARLREDVEDIWVEAREKCGEWEHRQR